MNWNLISKSRGGGFGVGNLSRNISLVSRLWRLDWKDSSLWHQVVASKIIIIGRGGKFTVKDLGINWRSLKICYWMHAEFWCGWWWQHIVRYPSLEKIQQRKLDLRHYKLLHRFERMETSPNLSAHWLTAKTNVSQSQSYPRSFRFWYPTSMSFSGVVSLFGTERPSGPETLESQCAWVLP